MASSTSTRRVLSDLNINAPVAKSVSTPLSKSGSGALFGEVKMVKPQGENAAVVAFAAEKRVMSSGIGGMERESASKRRKIGGEGVEDGERGYMVCFACPFLVVIG